MYMYICISLQQKNVETNLSNAILTSNSNNDINNNTSNNNSNSINDNNNNDNNNNDNNNIMIKLRNMKSKDTNNKYYY